jgi:hypothetical protein
MTPASDLLGRIRAAGVSVSLEPDGRLRVQPLSALPSDLLAAAKAHRDELVAQLARDGAAAPASAATAAGDPAPLFPAARQRIAERLDAQLARENEATNARWQQRKPNEAAIQARAAEVLARACANHASGIADEAKAAEYFRSRAISELMREAEARMEAAPMPAPPPSVSPAAPEPPPEPPPLTEEPPRDGPDPEADEHLSRLTPAAHAAFTSSPKGIVEARQREPTGRWSSPLTLRPPRFDTPANVSLPVCTGWCSGCGAPSAWRADPPAPNPAVLYWRCARCGGPFPGDPQPGGRKA